FGGQLLGTGDAPLHLEVYQLGAGVPTNGIQAVSGLPGMPTTDVNPWGFVFFDLNPISGDLNIGGMDTLYVANGSVGSVTGIQKWTYDDPPSRWLLMKTMNLVPPVAFSALAGLVTGPSVTLIASTVGSASNRLVVLVDDGSPNPTGTIIASG